MRFRNLELQREEKVYQYRRLILFVSVFLFNSEPETMTTNRRKRPAMNRSTDQVRHAEYKVTAMDAHAVVIHGHRFHHSTVMTALDTHAQVSHAAAVDAIAALDGHVNAGNIQYNDI